MAFAPRNRMLLLSDINNAAVCVISVMVFNQSSKSNNKEHIPEIKKLRYSIFGKIGYA